MCLILFAYDVHPKYRLVVAANRDEYYQRPTANAHFWEDEPEILAGRDLEKMGTWMGVSKNGRFAALTNFRNPKEQTDGKRSRGELVAEYLKGSSRPEEYLKIISRNRESYPGYNLLAGDLKQLYYYSNIENQILKLKPGIYGVSNHLLNTCWPKVTRGKEGLAALVKEQKHVQSEKLFQLLNNADPAADDDLPKTGVSLEWERTLSPIFIKSEGYGTRSSTVLLMSNEGIEYNERVYANEKISEQSFNISIS